MMRFILACLFAATCATAAHAQQQAMGETAKGMLGVWEFSNADRDRKCTATFKPDRAGRGGYKVEFEADCVRLFPIVADIAGWTFLDNDLLKLLDGQGKTLAEFSEVESGLYEAPTPGVGVLFLQNPAVAAIVPVRAPEQVAGDWTLMRGADKVLCTFTLLTAPVRDGFALAVQPNCDPAIERLVLTLWKMDGDELVLAPARGNVWRFEETDTNTWRRLPAAAEPVTLVRR
jgi:hypothetical protein